MAWARKPVLTAGVYPDGLAMEAIIDQIDSLTAPDWVTYVPSWTASSVNPAIGNGTLTGRYRRSEGEDMVHAEIRIAAGSTTTFGTGFWSVSLGVTPSTSSQNAMTQPAVVIDASTGNTYPCTGRIFGGLLVIGTPTGPLVTATVPMAWTTSDELHISCFYEPA